MRWRAEFYAFHYGPGHHAIKPDHFIESCDPPERFYETLYKGPGGYEKVVDQDMCGRRLVVFESASGVWYLRGTA